MAYSIIINYEKGNKKQLTKEIVDISIMEQTAFEKNSIVFLTCKGYQNPKVLVTLPKYSLLEFEEGYRRLFVSSNELQKGNQMILPSDLVELLYHAQHYHDIFGVSKQYVHDHKEEFEAVLTQVMNFAKKYTLPSEKAEKIIDIYSVKMKENEIEEAFIADSFVNLMELNAMRAAADFDFFKEKITRTRYSPSKKIHDAVLINQSITGLYETRRKLSEL